MFMAKSYDGEMVIGLDFFMFYWMFQAYTFLTC